MKWGTVAVAFAFSIRALLMYPLELLILKHVLSFPVGKILKLLTPQALAVVAMAITVGLVRKQLDNGMWDIFRLALSVLAGMCSYITLLLLLNRPLAEKIFYFLRRTFQTDLRGQAL